MKGLGAGSGRRVSTRVEASVSAVPAALHRALGVLLTPLVIGAGLLASRGGPGGAFVLAVLLAVLAVAAVVAAVVAVAGVRAVVARPGQRRRSTATTLPSTVASSPGIGS
ncbi:MAG: hypothetical protein K0S40_3753 [Actinomycetospora sp.]|nr:hypothetical protein [Actinomycetospora sp.]